MRLLSLLSAASGYLTGLGPCVVACIAMMLGTYVVKHVVDNASYLRFKAKSFEGEFRPRSRASKPKVKD